MDNRIGDIETARCGCGATVAHARINTVENRREYAEDGKIPDKAVAQDRITVTLDSMIVSGVGVGDIKRSAQLSFQMIGAGEEIGYEELQDRICSAQRELIIGRSEEK